MIMTIVILGNGLPRTAIDGNCMVVKAYKYGPGRGSNAGVLIS